MREIERSVSEVHSLYKKSIAQQQVLCTLNILIISNSNIYGKKRPGKLQKVPERLRKGHRSKSCYYPGVAIIGDRRSAISRQQQGLASPAGVLEETSQTYKKGMHHLTYHAAYFFNRNRKRMRISFCTIDAFSLVPRRPVIQDAARKGSALHQHPAATLPLSPLQTHPKVSSNIGTTFNSKVSQSTYHNRPGLPCFCSFQATHLRIAVQNLAPPLVSVYFRGFCV